nr:hypothetical protein B0A51_05548 [Rachicladosporium sp. CCFEE 5018]
MIILAKKKRPRSRGALREQDTSPPVRQVPFRRQQETQLRSTRQSKPGSGSERDRFSQSRQASSLLSIARSDHAGTSPLPSKDISKNAGDLGAHSLADEGDDGTGWTHIPVRSRNPKHLTKPIENPEDIDWCKTRENARRLGKRPSYRRQLQIDPKLRDAVESIVSRSSFVQAKGHLNLSDNPGESLMTGTIIQHQCQYRREDDNTPHKAGSRYSIKPDGTIFEIKDRFYIVLHSDGRSITEVPIFTYGGRGLRDRQRIRHRYRSVRPPHLTAAVLRNQSEYNPVLVVKELHDWRSLRDNMVAHVARVEVRKLKGLLFRRVGLLDAASIDAVISMAAKYEGQLRYIR